MVNEYEKLFALSLSTIYAKFHQNRFIYEDFRILPYMEAGIQRGGEWSKHEKLFALSSSTIHAIFNQYLFVYVHFTLYGGVAAEGRGQNMKNCLLFF